MPRQPRLDAPGVLHQVMVRGIERRTIFRDATDRADFVGRLAELVAATGLSVYAWKQHLRRRRLSARRTPTAPGSR